VGGAETEAAGERKRKQVWLRNTKSQSQCHLSLCKHKCLTDTRWQDIYGCTIYMDWWWRTHQKTVFIDPSMVCYQIMQERYYCGLFRRIFRVFSMAKLNNKHAARQSGIKLPLQAQNLNARGTTVFARYVSHEWNEINFTSIPYMKRRKSYLNCLNW